jgi:short-subunit dehydrogenase
VAPGFVDTPMSQSLREPRPFVISADTAAKIIIRNIARGRSKIIVPWPFAVLCAICGLLPRPLLRAAIAMTARRTSN